MRLKYFALIFLINQYYLKLFCGFCNSSILFQTIPYKVSYATYTSACLHMFGFPLYLRTVCTVLIPVCVKVLIL